MIMESFDHNEIREEAKQSARHRGFKKSKTKLWGPILSLHEYILFLPMTGIPRYDKNEL